MSSRVAISSEITEEIFALPLKGKALSKDFIRKRIITNEIPFNNPIKTNINKNTLERESSAKVMICHGGKEKAIAVNRNILARFRSYSKSSGKVVDYAEALRYLLPPIPLNITHPDGTTRKCKRADALKILLSSNTTYSAQPLLVNASSAFIYDLIAGIVGMSVHLER